MFEHVKALKDKGWLRARPNHSRSLELIEEEAEAASAGLPILGSIAAGAPIEAIDDRETLLLNELFPSDRDLFVLRVKGHSMIEDQIRDGDMVVVERREQAQPGETVVALEDGQLFLVVRGFDHLAFETDLGPLGGFVLTTRFGAAARGVVMTPGDAQ